MTDVVFRGNFFQQGRGLRFGDSASITWTFDAATNTLTGTAAGGPGGDAAWGDIGGTLADQTDLQSALDGKSATSHDHDGDYDALGAAAAAAASAASDLSDHEAAANPHPTYLTAAEGNAAYDALGAAAAAQAASQPLSSNLTEYAAVNPTAAGLALLDDADAAAQRTTMGVPAIPTGTPDGTKYLRDDNTWQAVAGGSGLTQPQVMARGLGA